MPRHAALPTACSAVAALLFCTHARADETRAKAENVRSLLAKNCGACHGPGGKNQGGFSFLLDRDRLVSRGFIRPGKPTESPLFQRIVEGEMPPEGKKPVPTDEKRPALRKWIEAG